MICRKHVERVMLRALVCWVVLFMPSMAGFAHAQTVSDDQAQPSATDNGDTIVITAEEIRAMQAHKMADVLNHVPGVTAGDSSVGIHGVYKVKVFVDGRPINDPTSSHGAVNWELVSPAEVERIEVLRGKGGLRYGQDASGGVILITTQRATRLTGNVKVYGGNYGTGYGYANLQMSAGRWSAGVSGGFETTDGYKTNNDKERWQSGAKVGYAIDPGRHLSLSVDHLEDERGSSGLPDYPTPHARKSSDNTNLSLRASWDPVTSTTFFNEGQNHNTDRSRGIDQRLRVSEWGEDLSVTKATGKWGELNTGAAFRLSRASGTNFDDQQEQTGSLFAAQTLHLFDRRLTLTAGLRGNVNSAFDDAVNPEVKLTYKKTPWRLSAVYSRTDNTPSFYQRYNQTSSTRPNPDLNMETADNYSLSLFVEPHARLSGSISLFYNRLADRITYVTGEDGIGQYRNFGLVTYTGGDLAVAWKAHDTLKIKGSYTYMEAVNEEVDRWLPAKARHTIHLDVYWKPTRPVSIVLTNKYVSKVYRNTANTKTVPEYMLTDLRAEYAFGRFSLFTEIENLFDKTYYYADACWRRRCVGWWG